ncbi:PQQ-dependent sugar dehydrogenase [Streptomyces sp. NPDC092296]|uniref:PQQ-dependent sugar dehydrogenase n=1 Tax=Streptomyces sp. NPDC092296 TaxID=3366012 RepID=UPI0038044BA6
MRRRSTALAVLLLCAALPPLSGCSSGAAGTAVGSAPPGTPAVSGTSDASGKPGASAAPAKGSARVTATVADGIETPWGLAPLPGGGLLVSSRDSYRVYRVDPGSRRKTVVGTVPGVVSNAAQGGEAGLLGLALSPAFRSDRLLYAYYSSATDNRIARMTYDPTRPAGSQLGPPQVILAGIPRGVHHDGGRIAFGPDGMLYAGTGDAGRPASAQDKSSLGGKILRMTPTGAPAPGNPFGATVVYSYGHRNVQGLAWDPQGRLWASEFGDKQADELNLILPGRNYGWPATQGRTDHPGYTSPVAQWGTEEDSPSGIAYAEGSIWMAALKGERLWRIPLDGTRVAAAPQAFLTGTYGRLRSVLADPDGTLLLTTSNTDGRAHPRPGDDRILRLTVH